MALPIPENAAHFIDPRDADNWRGLERRLAFHKNVNLGDFFPLATNGVLVIIELLSGRVDIIHLENLRYPEREKNNQRGPRSSAARSSGSSKAEKPKLTKKAEKILKDAFDLEGDDWLQELVKLSPRG